MLERLADILRDYVGDSTIIINEETTLKGDLGLDSLDLANLANMIEDEWNIEITDRRIKDIRTIGDIIKLIG